MCWKVINQSDIGVVEKWGAYSHHIGAGCHFVLWPMFNIATKLSTKVRPLEVELETKTKDNVFVQVGVNVQYQVSSIKEAAYKLTNPQQQMRAYIFDVIRSTIPRMELDEAFEAKETVSQSIKEQLGEAMKEYGYTIIQALVTDLTPDQRVREAMNQINTNKRMKEASAEKAEGEKIILVKAAEADAESKYLSGVGVAKQRRAIMDGLRESVAEFSSNVDSKPQDIINLLLATQYFDMLEDIGTESRHSAVFLHHNPGTVLAVQKQLTAGMQR